MVGANVVGVASVTVGYVHADYVQGIDEAAEEELALRCILVNLAEGVEAVEATHAATPLYRAPVLAFLSLMRCDVAFRLGETEEANVALEVGGMPAQNFHPDCVC